MKILGLDGKTYDLDVKPSKHPLRNKAASKSGIQHRCGLLLKEKFPNAVILEELAVPGHGFYLDFFLPAYKIVIEVQGAQHDKYTPYFHKSLKNFQAARGRDSSKAQWCEINNFDLWVVYSEEELKEKLK